MSGPVSDSCLQVRPLIRTVVCTCHRTWRRTASIGPRCCLPAAANEPARPEFLYAQGCSSTCEKRARAGFRLRGAFGQAVGSSHLGLFASLSYLCLFSTLGGLLRVLAPCRLEGIQRSFFRSCSGRGEEQA